MWDSQDKSFQDSTNILLGENQLQKFGKFLFAYTKRLNELQKDRFNYPNNSKNTYVKIKLLYHDENRDSGEQNERLINLVNTDNVIYNKIIIIFTYLNKEVDFITNELKTKYYDMLLYYGEHSNTRPVKQIGDMLKDIHDLSNLIKYAYKLLADIVKQLDAVYYFQWNHKLMCDNNICLYDIFLCIGELLMSFLTLDEIVSNQVLFMEHWNAYKQVVIAQLQGNTYSEIDNRKVKVLLNLMNEIENTILSEKIFANAMRIKFADVKSNIKLCTSIQSCIKMNIAKFENKQLSELTHHKCLQFVKLSALYVFYINIHGMNDKKLFKQVWDCFKKYTFFTMHCNVVWFPDVFFKKHVNINIDNFIDKKCMNSIAGIRDNYILHSHENLHKEVSIYNMYVLSWVIKFDEMIKKDISHMRLGEIKQLVNIVLDGLTLSGKIKRILINITNLYYTLNKPIVKNNVIFICKLIECLKYIQLTFRANFVRLCRIFNKLLSFLMYQCLHLIANMKKQLNPNKNIDILTSLVLIEKLLKGSCDNDKLLIIKHTFAFINKNIVREEDIHGLYKAINQLSLMYNIENIMESNCNVSFLYFHKNLLSIYIKHNNTNLNLKYTAEIINDICQVNPAEKDTYLSEIESNIVTPLCGEIETDLRLHSHLHLQVEKLSLDKVRNNVTYTFLLNPELLLIVNDYVDVKNKIESYLDRTFYDLTTIALHNYKTYNEMRSLAKYKYELNIIKNNLPCKTLDNGIDILYIIRNINSFINNYNYNINNQVFIENKSNSKFLNTVTINHIANNIRIYGIGIINTMINFIYQYLCKKLNLLIKYLYNENIKSKLIREIKFYRENKIKLNQKYPFDQAEKLLKGIKNIQEEKDLTDENGALNYLERFRVVITQIGNAIALIRMIRSGSLHYCANSVQFLPNLNSASMNIEEATTESEPNDDRGQEPPTARQSGKNDYDTKLSPNTRDCLAIFETVIKQSISNLQDSTDYFKLIINVFKPLLANTNIKHFYIVIPTLIFHYVQYILKIKEKITKIKKPNLVHNSEILNFTDDGFTLGLSYLIKIFNVNEEYKSLDFYSSVIQKYKVDPSKISSSGSSTSASNVDNLTLKTSQLYLNEFLLFYYNLNSVRIFFDQY